MLFFPIWKRVLVLGICLAGILFAMPNLFFQQADTAARARNEITRLQDKGQPVPADVKAKAAEWPDWLPGDVVNLGLDLRGGAYLLVEVQISEIEAERMDGLRNDVRKALIDGGVRRFTGLRASTDSVEVNITKPEDVAKAEKILNGLAHPVSGFLSLGGRNGSGMDLSVAKTGDQGFKLTMTQAAIQSLTDRAMQQSLEIVRRRIDAAGTREPTIQRQGDNRILIQVPGLGSTEELLNLIGRTAKLTFHKVDAEGPQVATPGPNQIVVPGRDGKIKYLLERRPVLSGENLVDSQPGFQPQTGLPIVNFRFDTAGARLFGKYTAAHVGQLFAIVLDNKVISAPRIKSPILGGSGYIEGNFTTKSATDLAILLRSGALPASIKVLEKRTVGPDLGADSVAQGQNATLVAFGLVVVYMLAFYGLFGVFANIALFLNVALIFALLSVIGATLTLPGIAGIALTIGMAVDANVLVFERIKEEIRSNKSVSRAIERGYNQAYSAILDANLTTLIAAVILFGMGSGPVKGFAVTLGFGIVTSVFTAVMVTRMVISLWYNWKRPKILKVSLMRMVPDETKTDFMRWRTFFAGLSAASIVAAAVLVATLGLNFGIDFRGGTMIEIRTQQAANIGQIRGILDKMKLGDVVVQSFGSPRDVLVRIEQQPGDSTAQMQAADNVGNALVKGIPGTEVRRTEVVGPKVSGELLQTGILAIVLAVAAISVYIWLRFEWQFGLGAVLSLVHDVALTMGVFAIFKIEFNLSIVAAILTIVGYSLNDTVVVYDRVRENLRKYKKLSLPDLMNLSVNETLSRTLMTSTTTLVALIAMFLLGPEVISGFTFAMIWGILVGTYSSIFVAAPLLMWFNVKRDWSANEDKKNAGVQFGGAQV